MGEGDYEEAIKSGLEFTVVVAPKDGAELLQAHAGVMGDEEEPVLMVDEMAEDREQGLAAAVVQDELVGGGGSAPALSDGTAA
jgi:hypothetical protein